MAENLFQSFLHQVRTRPDSVALIASRTAQHGRSAHASDAASLSWRQLAASVTTLVDAFTQQFGRDDSIPKRIGYASDNTLDNVVIALASMAVGAIEVPIDSRLGQASIEQHWRQVGGLWLERDLRWDLLDHALKARFDEAETLQRLVDASAAIDVDAPSLILWTSGTTDEPKGVVLSHRNLFGNAAAKLKAVPQTSDDVRLTALPLSHGYARTCDFGTWLISGGTLAVAMGYDGWAALGPTVRPTLANTVPSLARRIHRDDPDALGLDRLRILGCGGAAMDEDEFRCWSERGVTVIQGYGLTETSPVICSATPDDARPGYVGRFVDGWQHKIARGRLFVRGPHVMLGYWNDSTATAEKIDDEGWLDTGDKVEVDPESAQVRIIGRADDVIVLQNGQKVHPLSIEQAAERIDGVRHAMLVPAGERVELWTDLEPKIESVDAIKSQLDAMFSDRPWWQRPQAVHRFTPPLSETAGELTTKGTIRRRQIQQSRLSS